MTDPYRIYIEGRGWVSFPPCMNGLYRACLSPPSGYRYSTQDFTTFEAAKYIVECNNVVWC